MRKDYNKKIDDSVVKERSSANKEKSGRGIFYIFRVLFVVMIVILTYIVINFVKIFNKKGISIYEVTSGEIVNVDRHVGMIYRDERVEMCNTDGFINFYVANAMKVSRGSFVYSVGDVPNDDIYISLTNDDKRTIKQNVMMNVNNITDYAFSNIYTARNNIENEMYELSMVREFENVDIEKEISAKEKGYAKAAGLISFIIDGYENNTINTFDENDIKNYDRTKALSQKKEVNSGDKIYKLVTNPEYTIAFDSDFDYDGYKNKFVTVKFVYDNLTARAKISSFVGDDNKKHFALTLSEYPERFIDKRIVDFEIENKKISGLKIPIKSIVSKNCYIVPKGMLEKDLSTDETFFYKLGQNGEKIKVSCNISKEDDKYYYISIDDILSKLSYGDVLTNKYNDTYSLSEVRKPDGVYNVNKGYAVFKNVEVIDRTNEYAIVRSKTLNGISLYDHIALNSTDISEGDLIA